MLNEKELLKGLTSEGVIVNTRELARFTAENGVLVRVRCGRIRGRYTLPPKLIGLRPDKWQETNRDFFAGHCSAGRLNLIPKEMDQKLNLLDSRVRRLLQEYSINGTYIPLAFYHEFLEKFEAIRAEYKTEIDSVAENWETIRSDFCQGVRSLVFTIGKRSIKDKEDAIRSITSAIPTANAYRSSAYMTLEVRTFPTTGVTVEGLAADIEDTVNQTWRNDVVYNAVKSIETCIGQLFSQACKAASIYAKTGKMNAKSITALDKIAQRVKHVNLFANPMLATLSNRMSNITELNDEQAENIIEESILDSVEYAKSTGLRLDMAVCPFNEEQLTDMLELRHQFAAKMEKGA